MRVLKCETVRTKSFEDIAFSPAKLFCSWLQPASYFDNNFYVYCVFSDSLISLTLKQSSFLKNLFFYS